MESGKTKRAAIYTRISADQRGEALGVARQEEDARKLCAERGWTVARVYTDNDISAWSGKERPGYQGMLQDVRRGKVDVIVAWHPDRLHRQTRELVAFIDLVDEHHIQVETVTAGALDLSTPSGRMQARIVGTVAEYESEHKSERIKRKLQQNAAMGKPHGGNRPFGWKPDRITLDETEAQVVRDAAEMALQRQSMKSIARALNESGQLSSVGRKWRDVTVRDMLLRPRNAGLRQYHGEITDVKGVWEPIFDEETYYRLVGLLTDPRRRTTPGRDGQVHLITAHATCFKCGGLIVRAQSKPYKGVTFPVYRCKSGHVSRRQDFVDEVIAGAVIARMSLPDAQSRLTAPAEDGTDASNAMQEVSELQARLTEAASAYAEGALTLRQLRTITSTLEPKIAAAEAAITTTDEADVLRPLLENPAEAWERLLPEQRKAVVVALMDVTLLNKFEIPGYRNPECVRITWKR